MYGAFRRECLHEAVMGRALGPILDLMLKPNYIRHPDEFFFPTLACNSRLRLPGSCLHSPAPMSEVNLNYLPSLSFGKTTPVPHLFANKFHADYQPEAYDEMEEWYFQRVAAEIKSGSYNRRMFDPNIYAERLCSRYHI
ncbi:unnamed protein product [Mesocestoides corti]|uniref:AGC-kinase C-terminal domain-containing protein n=1 Tax=Mesocestoides corti TaxID=53468 RepID=A0A0R3U9H4_MESCO|nr:unnamed protein product [Mesocestoides corti]